MYKFNGAPGEVRTPDPQVRSLVLYPAELRAHKGILIKRIRIRYLLRSYIPIRHPWIVFPNFQRLVMSP